MPAPSTQTQQPYNLDILETFNLPSLRFTASMIIVFVISIVSVCIVLTRLHYNDLQDITRYNLHNLLLVQNQFNQKLFTDLDNRTRMLSMELQDGSVDADSLFHQYNALINNNSVLQTLLITDADGLVIFDSGRRQPSLGDTIADQKVYSVHTTQSLDELYIGRPIQSQDDDRWSVPLSKAIRDNNGDLSNVIVVFASPLIWSESLSDLSASSDYMGYLARDDGIVLSTFPFVEALIGTQLPASQLSILQDSSSDTTMLPSFIDDQTTLIEIQQLENAPAMLIIESVNTVALFPFDRVVITTTLIAIAVIISGIVFLYTYVGSYKALAIQTNNLNQTNLKLQQDVQARILVENDLHDSEDLYRIVTALISDYAFSINVVEGNKRILDWVTPSFYTMTGYPDGKFDEFYVRGNLVHPDDSDLVKRKIELTLLGQDTITEYRYRIKSGDYIWLRVKRHPIWDKNKERVIRYVGGGTNITTEKEAELALRESEERYRIVSEMMSGYAYSSVINEDGSISREWLTDSYYMMSGYDKKAAHLEFAAERRAHPDFVEMLANDMKRTLQGEETVSEYRWRVQSGDYIWLRIHRRPIWDSEHQKVIRIIAAGSDITIEKEAELARLENEKRYREVSELMSDSASSTYVSDTGQRQVEWVIGSLEQITGVSPQDLPNTRENLVKVLHPDDVEHAAQDAELALQGHKPISELRIIHAKTKEVRWLRIARQPIWNEEHTRIIRIMGGITDITAQKEAELALRQSEERYRRLTELMTDYAFLIRIEDDGRLYREWLVGDFEGIMGYSIPPSSHFDTPDVRRFYNDNIEMMQSEINKTIRGETSVAEYQIINRKDGNPRWIRVTRQPIWNQDHTKVTHYVGAVIDITLGKEAELITHEATELRRALEHEKGLHELRSRFVSMVTHEFRNPLAAIQSSTSILQQYSDRISESSRDEKFKRIYSQIDRLTNLLEDLLKVGELEHQILHFLPQQVDIIAIISELYAEYTDSIGHDYNLLLESDYDKIVLSGDPYLLQQALSNIISNAIKYSPLASDIICQVDLDEQQIVIRIIDNGVGIPEKDYDELFKAFYRASNVSTQPGTGLGLLIAQQAIELHHGTIDFTSKMGKGTTFTIILPQEQEIEQI